MSVGEADRGGVLSVRPSMTYHLLCMRVSHTSSDVRQQCFPEHYQSSFQRDPQEPQSTLTQGGGAKITAQRTIERLMDEVMVG